MQKTFKMEQPWKSFMKIYLLDAVDNSLVSHFLPILLFNMEYYKFIW